MRLEVDLTRAYASRAHRAFDPLWKEGHMTRSAAYAWLARTLGIDLEYCHMSMMSPRLCLLTERVSTKKLEELRNG